MANLASRHGSPQDHALRVIARLSGSCEPPGRSDLAPENPQILGPSGLWRAWPPNRDPPSNGNGTRNPSPFPRNTSCHSTIIVLHAELATATIRGSKVTTQHQPQGLAVRCLTHFQTPQTPTRQVPLSQAHIARNNTARHQHSVINDSPPSAPPSTASHRP